MPIYEYACSSCGKTLDVIQKVNDPVPARCENCGAEGTLSKLVSRSSFVLKGGGWYSDLYGSSKSSAKGSESKSSSASTSSSSGPSTSSSEKSSSEKSSSSSSSESAPSKTASGGDKS